MQAIANVEAIDQSISIHVRAAIDRQINDVIQQRNKESIDHINEQLKKIMSIKEKEYKEDFQKWLDVNSKQINIHKEYHEKEQERQDRIEKFNKKHHGMIENFLENMNKILEAKL